MFDKIRDQLGLEPHPEGGFYRRTYEADYQAAIVYTPGQIEERFCSTAIYYLLGAKDFSTWHQLNPDEMWHFYEGWPVKIMMLDPETSEYSEQIVGPASQGLTPQFVVKSGLWFSACVLHEGDPEAYSLCGCTVTPGFEFKDFKMASKEALVEMFPEHAAVISAFSRG